MSVVHGGAPEPLTLTRSWWSMRPECRNPVTSVFRGRECGEDGPVRSLSCPTCSRSVFFENSRCLACGTAIGFEPETFSMVAVPPLEPGGPDLVRCANTRVALC